MLEGPRRLAKLSCDAGLLFCCAPDAGVLRPDPWKDKGEMVLDTGTGFCRVTGICDRLRAGTEVDGLLSQFNPDRSFISS